MATRRRYRKRSNQFVIAIRLDLESSGLSYRKWGAEQHGKSGDWLVDNDGDVYTVDAQVFERTYRMVAAGRYVKITPVWAEQATHSGSVQTKEGRTHYEPGAFLVSNREDGSDAYAVSAAQFNAMYEPDGDPARSEFGAR